MKAHTIDSFWWHVVLNKLRRLGTALKQVSFFIFSINFAPRRLDRFLFSFDKLIALVRDYIVRGNTSYLGFFEFKQPIY